MPSSARHRRRLVTAVLALLVVVAIAIVLVIVASSGQAGPRRPQQADAGDSRHNQSQRDGRGRRPAGAAHVRPPRPATPPFPVAERTAVLVDHSRTVRLPDGADAPRTLRTLLFYPRPRGTAPETQSYPLVVFGHGFAVMPQAYISLLRAWARQGFVVAAPVFPLENPNAPGGPNEADLPNQPRDISFVISRLLAINATAPGPFRHLIDPHQIAVAGHSDGGDTALAVAYSTQDRDTRIKAAVILSGAEIPGVSLAYFQTPGPPLLAVQGTADTINPPAQTYQFFGAAPRPKYLLTLLAASHLPPYEQQPDLGIVERVTVAFLNRYLKHETSAGRQMVHGGSVPGRAQLSSYS